MIRKCLVLLAVSTIVASAAFAEPLRTFFVKENRMPGRFNAEIGAIGQYKQIPEERVGVGNGGDVYTAAPYLRYGLTDKLAADVTVPYVETSPDQGESERGLGDVDAGLELVAWQDIFGYPYIIPHADVSLKTGDEDKGLGTGRNLFTVGASLGTTTFEMFHYIVDASYTFHGGRNDDTTGESDNIATFAAAFVWDLDEQFSLIAEGKVTNDKNTQGDYPMYFQGGVAYQATENLLINVEGGGAKNTDEDVIISGKIAYSF